MAMDRDRQEERPRLEVPEQVYRRLVRVLINSVLQEKSQAAPNRIGGNLPEIKRKGAMPR